MTANPRPRSESRLRLERAGQSRPSAILDRCRGYCNHATLADRRQDALVRQAFTPCLQYRDAAGKNTSDIALALHAVEGLHGGRLSRGQGEPGVPDMTAHRA